MKRIDAILVLITSPEDGLFLKATFTGLFFEFFQLHRIYKMIYNWITFRLEIDVVKNYPPSIVDKEVKRYIGIILDETHT